MRLELTKRTDLAFRALTAIESNPDHRVNGTTLAGALDITTHYLPTSCHRSPGRVGSCRHPVRGVAMRSSWTSTTSHFFNLSKLLKDRSIQQDASTSDHATALAIRAPFTDPGRGRVRRSCRSSTM